MKNLKSVFLQATLLLIGLFSATSVASASDKEHEGEVHWAYEGETGPDKWGNLSSNFAMCNGVNQSPVNVTNAVKALLPDIKFDYKDAPLKIVNNGHTIQVNFPAGSSILINEHKYELLQFHFHTPGENQVDGMSFPLEVHLVHKDADGNLAVVGVLFKEGPENPMIKGLWQHLAGLKVNEPLEKADVAVNAYGLLPNNKEYYEFSGSLTTPPCSEGVRWLLMKTPIELSSEQVKQFVDVVGHNSRPVQKINARAILK